jgi:phosphoglycolate phosphatase
VAREPFKAPGASIPSVLHGIRLIIYDLDGTLIDSTEAIVETFNRVVEEQGAEACPTEAIREMIGLPRTDMFRKVLPGKNHANIQACWDRYIKIYDKISPAKTHILPSVEEALTHFKKAGYMQSVATTKRGEVASHLLADLGIRGYFDLVLGINDVPSPKPAPDIINLTLERLHVKPREAVFVEDTTIGLEAGKRADVYTVGVTTGTHDMMRLASMRPDIIIDSMLELTRLVER